ncbi:MAG: hypothetical protein RIQ81_489 [Pseudomonadota bacterium]|jgi:hypothetical protein
MSAPFKLKNGSVAVLAEVPGGLYNSAHLKKIAAIADQHSLIMKATEDQRIAMFVTPEQAESITRDLAAGGLTVRDYQAGVHQPVACIGALCPESKQDALKASMEITEALAGVSSDCALKIGINGCANCCVPCHTLDIAVVGTEEGYRMTLGGKQALVPELGTFAGEGIPAAEVVGKVKDVVDVYRELAQPGESLAAVIERAGMTAFVKALAPYSGDAGGVAEDLVADAPAAPQTTDSGEASEAVVAANPGDEVVDPNTVAVDEEMTERALEQSIADEANIPVVIDENAEERDALLASMPDNVVEMPESREPLEQATEPSTSALNASSMNIEGMEIGKDGKFTVTFSNGASIAVDPGVIPFAGSRTVRFAGKELLIRADVKGFNIEVDGLAFHLPLEAA